MICHFDFKSVKVRYGKHYSHDSKHWPRTLKWLPKTLFHADHQHYVYIQMGYCYFYSPDKILGSWSFGDVIEVLQEVCKRLYSKTAAWQRCCQESRCPLLTALFPSMAVLTFMNDSAKLLVCLTIRDSGFAANFCNSTYTYAKKAYG